MYVCSLVSLSVLLFAFLLVLNFCMHAQGPMGMLHMLTKFNISPGMGGDITKESMWAFDAYRLRNSEQ